VIKMIWHTYLLYFNGIHVSPAGMLTAWVGYILPNCSREIHTKLFVLITLKAWKWSSKYIVWYISQMVNGRRTFFVSHKNCYN